jgi:hypothetical protein
MIRPKPFLMHRQQISSTLHLLFPCYLFSYLQIKPPNELRIDVAARANAEAQFNAPPHQS